MKSGKLLLFALLFLFFCIPVLHAAGDGVAVSATATVRVMPDRATFNAVSSSTDVDQAKAAERTARIHDALQRALRGKGIPESDAPSIGYTVLPEWEWDTGAGRNRLRGYTARHVIRVTVRDPKRAGSVIDAVVDAGASEVQQLQFTSSREDELRREALQLAVTKARRDAEAMASAAGVRLGEPLEISTASLFRPIPQEPVMMARSAEAPVPTVITPAEEEITVTVQARWGISRSGSR